MIDFFHFKRRTKEISCALLELTQPVFYRKSVSKFFKLNLFAQRIKMDSKFKSVAPISMTKQSNLDFTACIVSNQAFQLTLAVSTLLTNQKWNDTFLGQHLFSFLKLVLHILWGLHNVVFFIFILMYITDIHSNRTLLVRQRTELGLSKECFWV